MANSVAILGAGFTGLSAAYALLKKGYEVTIFEKDPELGGLAVGFSNPKWSWTLERAYHHWFTNDSSALNLAEQIDQKVIIKRPSTDLFINGKIFPFDSPLSLIKFPHLSIVDKLRIACFLLFLKSVNNYRIFEGQIALDWLKRFMGEKVTRLIWEPLLAGKFGQYKNDIAMTWFWARIKKRTPFLAYPAGGFKAFADRLGDEIRKMGGEILTNAFVSSISPGKNVQIKFADKTYNFDQAVVTLPSPVFAKIANLPQNYAKKISSMAHLHALVLILVLKKPFMKKTYWLNITERGFPFLVLAEHTNFMDPKHFGGQHLLYIGNYLPPDHPYLKMSSRKLIKIFDPYLKKISPNYHLSLVSSYKFIGPFAQPVVTTKYSKSIPRFKTPLKNIYLANLDMVYPWDRGTNYAIEMGEKIADNLHHLH